MKTSALQPGMYGIKNALIIAVIAGVCRALPNVIAGLTEAFAALTGERLNFVSIEDGAIEVSRRLEDRNCLWVIDDVWSPAHVRPFLRGAAQCVRLITSRQFEIATEFAVPGRRTRTPLSPRSSVVDDLRNFGQAV